MLSKGDTHIYIYTQSKNRSETGASLNCYSATYLSHRSGLIQHQEDEGGRIILLIIVEGNLARAEVELDSLDVMTMIVCNEYQLVRTVSKHTLKQFRAQESERTVIAGGIMLDYRMCYMLRWELFLPRRDIYAHQ